MNAAVHNEETHKFWLDQRRQTFLKPRVELRGQFEGMDDPETVVYELRVRACSLSYMRMVADGYCGRPWWSKSLRRMPTRTWSLW